MTYEFKKKKNALLIPCYIYIRPLGIFRCAEEGCGRAFTASHHLKTHKRTHSADKLYTCDRPNCNKTFPGKGSLKTHQRSHDIWDESETLSDFADDLLQHFDSETCNSTTSEYLNYHSTLLIFLIEKAAKAKVIISYCFNEKLNVVTCKILLYYMIIRKLIKICF